MQRLQRIKNNAARIASKVKKFDHINPTLMELHWLPVKERIRFKFMLLTYKALNGKAPAYLIELLTPYSPTRSLRSEDQCLLTVPTQILYHMVIELLQSWLLRIGLI